MRDIHKLTTSVYLIGNDALNYYKIGMAINPLRRMKALSLPFEVKLIASIEMRNRFEALDLEQGLHIHYADRALQGEWFSNMTAKDFMDSAETLATQYLATKRSWN
jgi:hypothetical protein